MKASAGTSALTIAASRSAASVVAARRAPHSANVSGARGAPSSVTVMASRPVSSRAQACGSAIVAEASTNTGSAAVMRGDAAQPAQDLRDVRPEHPAVAVAFVDDDHPQPLEEAAPAAVAGSMPLCSMSGFVSR